TVPSRIEGWAAAFAFFESFALEPENAGSMPRHLYRSSAHPRRSLSRSRNGIWKSLAIAERFADRRCRYFAHGARVAKRYSEHPRAPARNIRTASDAPGTKRAHNPPRSIHSRRADLCQSMLGLR